jgi:hypothetical protein
LLRLVSPGLEVEIDPNHGAEILTLAEPGGENLLWRAPWDPGPPLGGLLDEIEWTAHYRGGWQEVFPNAGNDCVADGRRQGFHGEASNSPWSVLDSGRDRARLRWSDGKLALERDVTLATSSAVVHFHERVSNSGAAPRSFIWVHHLAFGGPLLRPGSRIDAPAGRAYSLDERTGPVSPPPSSSMWPFVDGDDWSQAAAAESCVRFGCLTDLRAGWAAIRNPAGHIGVGLAWPLTVLPHMWTYQDIHGVESAPWLGRGEFVMLEPSRTPHSLGLAAAIANGQDLRLERGGQLESWLTVVVFRPQGRVTGIDQAGVVTFEPES